MENKELKIGDTVIFSSVVATNRAEYQSRFVMTVIDIFDTVIMGRSIKKIECCWIERDSLKYHCFRPELLLKIN